MRGKPGGFLNSASVIGNIPAYAGKTTRGSSRKLCSRGTSPRMRGKHGCKMTPIQIHRNIPAYAGKTLCHKALVRTSPEHPRVCGENWVGDQNREAHFGTSPRMRGKPCLRGSAMTYNRNIPAYAGKTERKLALAKGITEHPRVCGEN